MPRKKVKCQLAAFDMDGVVLDSMTRLRHLGVQMIASYPDTTVEKAEAYYDATAGLPFRKQLDEIFGVTFYDHNREVARAYEQAHHREAIGFPLNPDIVQVLNTLNRLGVVAVLVSSTSRDIIHERIPHVHHIGFKAVYGYETSYRTQDGEIQPFNKAAQIRAACSAFSIGEADTILFGDTMKDKDAATEADVDFCLVTISTLSYWVEREWSL